MPFIRFLTFVTASIGAAGFAVICIVYLWDFPLHDLSRSVKVGNLTVTVTQRGEERWLTVSDGNKPPAKAELMSVWGPDLRTNLYRVDQSTIAIIDFGAILAFDDRSPGLTQVQPKRRWVYLGAFLRDGNQLKFFPKGTLPECMDILMDEAPPENERKNIYRRQCDEAAAVIPPSQ